LTESQSATIATATATSTVLWPLYRTICI